MNKNPLSLAWEIHHGLPQKKLSLSDGKDGDIAFK